MYRELIVTPGVTLTFRQVVTLESLLSQFQSEINQVTFNMKRCQRIPSESIHRLHQLHQVCNENRIQLTMINCSGVLLKTLICTSIKFLDIAQV